MMLTKHGQAPSLSDPHSSWVEDLALEMLEALYFDFKMLVSNSSALLASSLTLAALFILSQNHGLFKSINASKLKKLSAQSYNQFIKSPAILSIKLS